MCLHYLIQLFQARGYTQIIKSSTYRPLGKSEHFHFGLVNASWYIQHCSLSRRWNRRSFLHSEQRINSSRWTVSPRRGLRNDSLWYFIRQVFHRQILRPLVVVTQIWFFQLVAAILLPACLANWAGVNFTDQNI